MQSDEIKSPMTFRKLRIAWSVVWGLACVLLLVLWVRSHYCRDYCSIGQFANRGWSLESGLGQLAFRLYPINHNAPSFTSSPTAVFDDRSLPANNPFGFNLYFGRDFAGIVVPHWLLVLLTAYIAASAAVGRVILFRFRPLKRCWPFGRITFSVLCGLTCVLLTVLWVRSYWWSDGVMGSISSTNTLVVGSGSGRFSVRVDDSTQPHRYSGPWQVHHTSLSEFESNLKKLGQTVSFRFPIFGFIGDDFFFSHWFVIIPAAVLGLILSRPWLRLRFTTRTLLIATTLVALALGLAVYAARGSGSV